MSGKGRGQLGPSVGGMNFHRGGKDEIFCLPGYFLFKLPIVWPHSQRRERSHCCCGVAALWPPATAARAINSAV